MSMPRILRVVPGSVAAMLICVSGSRAADLTPPPADLLRRAAANCSWTADGQFDFVSSNSGSRTHNGQYTGLNSRSEGTVTRHGADLRIRVTTLSNAGRDPVVTDRLCVNGKFIAWVHGDGVSYSESPAFIAQGSGVSYASVWATWPLDGVVSLDDRYPAFDLATAAKEGRISELPGERVGDLECRVVRATGDGWDLKIWIAPGRSNAFAKYELTATADEAQGRRNEHIVVDHVELAELEVQGQKRWVARSAKYRSDWSTPDGKTQGVIDMALSRPRMVAGLSDSELKAAFAPVSIPDGTPVQVTIDGNDGKPKPAVIPYRWKAGKPEPAYDPKVLELLKQSVDQVNQSPR